MDNKFKTNLSKVEKIIIAIYIIYVVLIQIICDELLISIIIMLIMIVIASKRKSTNTDANYIVKERIETIIKHFFLLCIFWNILWGIVIGDVAHEFGLFNIVLYTFILIILILPFSGILKAISKIQKIDTYKNIEMYRELPQNIEPAIIAYLIQDKISDKSDISATLLDLVRRGYLVIEEDTHNGFNDITKGILNKKLVVNKSPNNLKAYEKFLISWFLESSKKPNQIDMKNLKDMLNNSDKHKEKFNEWERLVKQEAEKTNFYDDNSKLSKFSKFSIKWAKWFLIISVIILVLAILGASTEFIIELPEAFYMACAILVFVHMILAILSIIIYDLRLPKEYLNELGKENIRKWNGFIKFLKEYTLINERKTEEVVIWEEYLVYGVAFGVAKETIHNMNKAYGLNSYVKDIS